MKKYLIAFLVISKGLIGVISAEAQSCVQPAPNMVSWWKAEGNAADTRNLNSGNLQNGVNFAAGRVGQAFNFDGTDDAILLGNNLSLQPASMTVEAWVNKNSLPAGIENIFAKWGFDATVDSHLFGVINDGGQLRAFGAIGDGSTGDPGLSGGTIPLNAWTHLAMTYNATDGAHKLYVNGAEVASRIRLNGIFSTGTNAYIGREDSPMGRFFTGLVDELSLYNRALTTQEIQAIFNAGGSGKCQTTLRYTQKQKIQSTPIAGSTGFGYSVAIDGDTMVVGANGYDTTPTTEINRGAAYVFVRMGGVWIQQAQLLANDGAAGDEFGNSVAISGDTIVVGSWRNNAANSNSGAAYVFTRSGTTWTQQQKLTANDGAADDEFGNSVTISGDTVAVGAHSADYPNGGGHGGAVYIYNRSGSVWSQAQKLTPTGQVIFGDFLGFSVAISGDTLVAGASGDQEPTRTNRGSVYVYARVGGVWAQQIKLEVPDSQPSTQLGSSVAIDGETIVSGALGDTPVTGQPNYGAVYVFGRTGGSWTAQQRLTASDGAMSDFFGWSVAVRGGIIAVGSRHDDTTAGADTGSTYIFGRDAAIWTERQKLAPTDAAANDRFGVSAALNSDGTLVVGASDKNLPAGQGNGAGAAYVFNNVGKTVSFDYDGDAKTDISIFRPSVGQWWYLRSSNGTNFAATFGAASDKIVPADYTGDGKSDFAFFRPSSGQWFVLRSEDFSFFAFPFGVGTDTPVPADYDGDGKADAAVFRESSLTWFIQKSSGGTDIVGFGTSGDKPVVSDYDGDGKADIAIYRPSVGQWWIRRSSNQIVIAFQFGMSTDKPLPNDFTGDGKADIAVWQPSTGEWFVLRSEDNSFFSFPFGASGDVPVVGDYDGDGKADAGVFRPSNSTWFIQRSTAGILIQTFGTTADVPTPNAFVP